MEAYVDGVNGNGKATRRPITISIGAAVGVVMVCLLPGLAAWFRMEAAVGHMAETLRAVAADLKETREDVIRLKAWREGLRQKDSEFHLAPVR